MSLLILLYIIQVSYGAELSFVKRFANLLPSTGSLAQMSVRGKLGCAEICARTPTCQSLFYVSDTRQCQLHDRVYSQNSTGLNYTSSAVYYDTGTDTADNTDTFCPSSVGSFFNFNEWVLPSGVVVKYSLGYGNTYTYQNAAVSCMVVLSRVYTVLTEEKLNFTQQLLSCPELSGASVWVNGHYNITWTTYNGQPIPMSDTFWSPDQPDNLGVDNCMIIDGTTLKFDDTSCTKTYLTICER